MYIIYSIYLYTIYRYMYLAPLGYTCEVGADDYQNNECSTGHYCPAKSS